MFEYSDRFEAHIPVTQSGQLAVDLLAEHCSLSKQQIKNMMLKGAVWLTKGKKTLRLRRAKRALNPKETIHLYYDRKVLEQAPIEVNLVADHGDYSVWNKPFGMLSQGSKYGDHCSVTRWAEQFFTPNREVFLIHRLDREANGLIIVAHNKKAAAALSKLFQSRDIDKRYRVTVSGLFPDSATSASPMMVDESIDGKSAVSFFSLLNVDKEKNRSELDVSIDTGRKHQIRRHLLGLNHPVIGDTIYGRKMDGETLHLQAYYLAFICPLTGQNRVYNVLL